MSTNNVFNNNKFEEAYNSYFNIEEDVTSSVSGNINNANYLYTYQSEIKNNNINVKSTKDVPYEELCRYLAQENIDDIDLFADKIRLVLNAAWGEHWGLFGPELKESENPENIVLPQITYDLLTRVIPSNAPLKPKLINVVAEIVNGKGTGDYYNLYRQWFDCVVEFNIIGKNSLEARKLLKKFETIMSVYIGHFKELGIQEILFLKEIHPTQSSNFKEGMPTKTILYLVKLERITIVKSSTLRKIEISSSNVDDKNVDFPIRNNIKL